MVSSSLLEIVMKFICFSFQLVSQLEKELIDRIIDHGYQKAGDLDYNLVHSLYKLVLYFAVIITGYNLCFFLPNAMGIQHNLCVHNGCSVDCCSSLITGDLCGLLLTLYNLSFIE